MADRGGVLAVLLASDGPLSGAGCETLGVAAALAQASACPLHAAVLGERAAQAASEAARFAERVYLVEHPAFAEFEASSWLAALDTVVTQVPPALVLLGGGPAEREMAPRLAVRHGWGVLTDCVRVQVDASGEVGAVCPIFGGTAEALFQLPPGRPCVVTVRAGSASSLGAPRTADGDVVRVAPPLDQAPRRVRVVERSVAPGPKLEDARTIVAGGKGLLRKENFRYVEELAAVLGGMPAASRAIVDIGWASPAQQVGLTGRTVAPDLYLALGVSGASQHMAGCSSARTIVAVNLDKDAAIMRYARYGVVADCLEFLPAFIEACRAARAQSNAA